MFPTDFKALALHQSHDGGLSYFTAVASLPPVASNVAAVSGYIYFSWERMKDPFFLLATSIKMRLIDVQSVALLVHSL